MSNILTEIETVIEELRSHNLLLDKAEAELALLLNTSEIRLVKEEVDKYQQVVKELEGVLVDYTKTTDMVVEHPYVITKIEYGRKNYTKTRPKFLKDNLPEGMDLKPFEKEVVIDWLKVQKHLGYSNDELPFEQPKSIKIEYKD